MANKGADLEIRAKDSATPVIQGVAVAVDGIAPAAGKAGAASDAAFKEIKVGSEKATEGVDGLKRKIGSIDDGVKNTAANAKGVADAMGSIAPAAGKAGAASETAFNKVKAGSKSAGDGVDGLAKKFGEAKNQVAALAGINIGQGMVRDVLATADSFKNLQARVKLATGEGEVFKSSFKEVSEISLRTSSNLEQTGLLFGKLTEAGKSAGLSTQAAVTQALGLTESINQAVQLSGGSAEASKAAITQLIQGLQSGVLRGDEFNSVMEQAPRLSKALADSLGVTTGELRKMAEAGTLSSDTVIKALKGQASTLQAEFATLPTTVGRSVEKLQTQWMLYIGDLDKGNGITAKVAQGLDLLAGNLNGVLQVAQAGGAAWLGYKAAQKLVGDGAVETAVKVTKQAAASAEAAVATTAHGVAAGKAGVQLAGYGAAATATGAQIAAANATGSAAAVGGFKAATAGVVGFLGKLGSIGAIAYAAYEVTKLAFSAGDALLKKWSGLSAAEDALAASDKRYADALKDSQAAQEAQTAAKQAAIDKTFGLTKESAVLVGKFGELVKAGDSVTEAIGKIGKDFDLSTIPGIQQAGSVLDKLVTDGKISAAQFNQAWSDALKGVDLAELEVKARAAFAGSARGAVELQQALDAGVREAIKRTGLDFEVISGGMGKASRSAINDTNAIIAGLDQLKAEGVDTGQALSASLTKGINTADSVKALDEVRRQVEQVRSALGDKVADGLLDQAKTKALELKDALEKATPGIQSVIEAMKQLGVTSDVEFKAIAEKSKTAFDVMKTSGTGSARELSEAFRKVAADAIAANGGVAPEWVKTEAAVRGVTIAVDANGKATVENARKSKEAIGEVSQAFDAQAAAAGRAALAAVNAKYSRPEGGRNTDITQGRNDPMDVDYIAALRVKMEKGLLTAADTDALRNASETLAGIWRMDQAVMKLDPAAIDPSGVRSSMEWATVGRRMEEALKALEKPSRVGENGTATPTPTPTQNPAAQSSSRSVFVNINTPKGLEQVHTDAAGAQALVRSLKHASQSAGF